MKVFTLLILTQFLATSFSQLVINGDTRIYAKYSRAKALEGAATRKIVNQEVAYADKSDAEYGIYGKKLAAEEYKARGSKYFADGTPIPGNENVDLRPIDPRTPPGFGNPFMAAIHKSRAMLSKAVVEEAKFWNVSIPVKIGDKTIDLPISNGDFSEALTLWYQGNYEQFVKTVEHKPFTPMCEVEMDADALLTNYVNKYCPDHCHCYGHEHNCCLKCQYGQVGAIYECQYYKVIADAQIAIAQATTYQMRRTACLGTNDGSSGGAKTTPQTKQEKLENPIELKKTVDHPMKGDVAISRGVF